MNLDKRDSNIELLRITSIIGVIILHFNYNGGMDCVIQNDNWGGYGILILLEAISICAVDLFMLISGYFMCKVTKPNMVKPAKLIIQVIVFNVLWEIVKVIIDHDSFKYRSFLPNNYFVIFYISVFIISPYLNNILCNTSSHKKMIMSILILFSIYPTFVDILTIIMKYQDVTLVDLSNITRNGSLNGYSIIHFIIMYLIGGCVRISEEKINKISTAKIVLGYLSCTTCTFVCTLILCRKMGSLASCISLSYANPIVILQSMTLFILFKRIDMGKNKIINRLSGACFTAYLTHGYLVRYFIRKEILSCNFVIIALYVLGCAFLLYFLAFLVEIIYGLCEAFIYENIKK